MRLRSIVGPFAASVGVSLGVLVFEALREHASIASILAGWDAVYYLRIAASGYPAHLDPVDAFFPGYPLLIWALTHATRSATSAAVLVSLAAEFVALVYVGKLAALEADERTAKVAVWLVALFPTALFFSVAYGDGCLVAASAASLYYARRGRPWSAAAAAMLAGAFKIFAVALIPALAYELWARRAPARDWASLLLAPTAIAAYTLFLYVHTGDAAAFTHAEALPNFGATLTTPLSGAARSIGLALHDPSEARRAVYVAALGYALGAAVLVALAWAGRLPRSLALYVTVAAVLIVSVSTWRSTGRYDLTLFPLAIVLAGALRQRVLSAAAVGVSGLGLALAAATYAAGAWVG